MRDYLETIYNIVEAEAEDMDAIYGDFIEHLIGSTGLLALLGEKLLEGCGVVNGRRLYVLVPTKRF